MTQPSDEHSADNARKWEVGTGRLKDPAFALNVQVDRAGIFLSAVLGHRHLYALRHVIPPEKESNDPSIG